MNGRTPFFSWKPLPRAAAEDAAEHVERRGPDDHRAVAERELLGRRSRARRRQLQGRARADAAPPGRHVDLHLPRRQPQRARRPSRATQPTPWTSRSTSTGRRWRTFPARRSPPPSRTTSSSRRMRASATSSTTRSPSCRCTRRAAPSKPTTYPDETTSYYWAVLPAIGLNGSLASRQSIAGIAAELPEAVHAAGADGAGERRLGRAPADLPVDAGRGRPPLPGPGRGRSDVRLAPRRRAHRLDGVHEQHLVPGRHHPLLARPRRRREPDRPDVVERSGPSAGGSPRRY